ncbi:hypothetical protein STANM337S_04089 [Streptomyces tanashiensis]
MVCSVGPSQKETGSSVGAFRCAVEDEVPVAGDLLVLVEDEGDDVDLAVRLLCPGGTHVPLAGGGERGEIDDSAARQNAGHRTVLGGDVGRLGGGGSEPSVSVDRKPQRGDAGHAAVEFASGEEDDVCDARREVDRGGPAQLDDPGPRGGRLLVGAAQNQDPPTAERLGGMRGLGSPGRRHVRDNCGRSGGRRRRSRRRGRGRRFRGLLRCLILVRCSGTHLSQQLEERVLVDDRDALGDRASCLRRARSRVVGDESAGVPTDRRHDVQASGDRPGHQLGPGSRGLARDGDLHALDERTAGCQAAWVPVGARGLRRIRRELRILPGRAGHQRQRDVQPCGFGEGRAEDPREDARVVQRVMSAGLRYAVVSGQRRQAEVDGGRLHTPVQRQGAQPLGDREIEPGAGEFMGQKVVVELCVVSHHDPVLQERSDPSGYLLEGRGAAQPFRGQAVDVHGAGVAARVQQGGVLAGLGPVRPESQHRDREDPVTPGDQAGCLDVDQSPVVRVVGQV